MADVFVDGLTACGKVRKQNEDALLLMDLTTRAVIEPRATVDLGRRGILVAVSDGLGGAPAGDVASALSVAALSEALAADCIAEIGERLREDVVAVSQRVREAAASPERRGMGATLTAAIITRNTAHIAQVGDSRAYLFRAHRMIQLTRDQTFVQGLVDDGLMTEREAAVSPQRNMVQQVMGQREPLDVVISRIALQPGDRLLLCSDGLSGVVPPGPIEYLLGRSREYVCADLVHSADAVGSPDNVTVVLVEIGER